MFVTVQDTGGSYGLAAAPAARAWHGGFAGLAKSAAKEWPAVAVRSIDLECGKLKPQQLGSAWRMSCWKAATNARLDCRLRAGGCGWP